MALEMATENDLSGIKRPPEMPEQLRMIVRNSLMDTLEAKSAVSMASLKLSAKILPTFAPPTNSADIWKRKREREKERQRDREKERNEQRYELDVDNKKLGCQHLPTPIRFSRASRRTEDLANFEVAVRTMERARKIVKVGSRTLVRKVEEEVEISSGNASPGERKIKNRKNEMYPNNNLGGSGGREGEVEGDSDSFSLRPEVSEAVTLEVVVSALVSSSFSTKGSTRGSLSPMTVMLVPTSLSLLSVEGGGGEAGEAGGFDQNAPFSP